MGRRRRKRGGRGRKPDPETRAEEAREEDSREASESEDAEAGEPTTHPPEPEAPRSSEKLEKPKKPEEESSAEPDDVQGDLLAGLDDGAPESATDDEADAPAGTSEAELTAEPSEAEFTEEPSGAELTAEPSDGHSFDEPAGGEPDDADEASEAEGEVDREPDPEPIPDVAPEPAAQPDPEFDPPSSPEPEPTTPPPPSDPSIEKAAWYRDHGDAPASLDLLRRVVEERPQDAVARIELAHTFERLGEYDRALKQLEIAATLEADPLHLHLREASVHAAAAHFEAASEALARASRIDGENVEVRTALGVLSYRRGLYDDAAERLAWVCAQDENHALAHHYRGEALNRVGRIDEAIEVLLRTVELDPSRGRAWHTLGVLYDKKRLPVEASEAYRRAREEGR